MKKRTIYLALQAAACCVLAALLAASAISILRDGLARKALDPLASVYTPEIVSEKLVQIAPLFFAALGLLVVGLALGIREEGTERPARDAALARDLIVGRVHRPSEAMRRERAAQRRLGWFGWVAFALCMVPIAAYLANPGHFTPDLEAMFRGLVRVFLPWSAAGLGALAVTAVLRQRSILRETEAAGAQLRAERAAGLSPAAATPARPKRRGAVQAALLAAAVALIVAGILNGSAGDVLHKAIMICTECVGLG